MVGYESPLGRVVFPAASFRPLCLVGLSPVVVRHSDLLPASDVLCLEGDLGDYEGGGSLDLVRDRLRGLGFRWSDLWGILW